MTRIPRPPSLVAARSIRTPSAAEPPAPAQHWRVARAVVEALTLPFRRRHADKAQHSLDARMLRDVVPDEDWRG